MDGLLVTHRGLESVAKLEVEELLKQKAKIEHCGVSFSVKKIEELAKLCYLSQSAKRILLYFGSFKVGKLEETVKAVQAILDTSLSSKEAQPFIKQNFMVDCERLGNHNFNSADVQEEIAEYTRKKLKLKSDYKAHFFSIFIYIDNEIGHVGLDMAGKDLSKRKYKVYNYGSSIKGTIAYGLVRLAGFDKKKILLDPFCNTGTIPIEACLFQEQVSPWFYDRSFLFKNYCDFKFDSFQPKKSKAIKNILATEAKQKYTSSAKKNATVAGVPLQISRVDIEWMDTKFEKESIDIIATKPIIPSKIIEEKIAEKLYKDFYYNADFVLKKNGKLAFITEKKELLIKTGLLYKFTVEKEIVVEAGQIEYTVVIMKR
jgi:putative N6-adenine-specific DNA methylase